MDTVLVGLRALVMLRGLVMKHVIDYIVKGIEAKNRILSPIVLSAPG